MNSLYLIKKPEKYRAINIASSLMFLVKLYSCMLKNLNSSMLITMQIFKAKWIKALNIKSDTLNLINKRLGNITEIISTAIFFPNRTVITQILRTVNK